MDKVIRPRMGKSESQVFVTLYTINKADRVAHFEKNQMDFSGKKMLWGNKKPKTRHQARMTGRESIF